MQCALVPEYATTTEVERFSYEDKDLHMTSITETMDADYGLALRLLASLRFLLDEIGKTH